MKIKILSVLLTFIILSNLCGLKSTIVFAQDSYLKAGVTHSEFLPQAPISLSVGEVFDKDNNVFVNQKPKFDWYRIPNVLAGIWKSDYSKILSSTSIAEGRSGQIYRSNKTSCQGTLKDRNGNVWYCNYMPVITYVDLNSDTPTYACAFYTYSQLLDSDDNHYTILCRSFVTSIQRSTNKIFSNTQCESIQRFELVKDNYMHCINSSRFFDSRGKYLYQTVIDTYYNKIKDFQNRMFGVNNFDFKKSFVEYLKHYDLQDLIPD